MTGEEIALRLGLASLAGLLLGIDRELRGISAGIRTHALVALSSALITVSALMLQAEFAARGETGIDPLRVIQGLAQAVGFVAAGAIFVSAGSVHNLTSAANIWLAAALGIASGADERQGPAGDARRGRQARLAAVRRPARPRPRRAASVGSVRGRCRARAAPPSGAVPARRSARR